MNDARRKRALGLVIVAALGLMAIMASGAQGLAWFVEGKAITANQVVEASTHIELNLKVKEETNLEILCKTIKAEDLLLIAGTTQANGKVKFETCKIWQNGKDISANCKPAEPITLTSKILIILHPEFYAYLLFEPETVGGALGQVKFKAPCALPETNNLKGSFMMECARLEGGVVVGENCMIERVSHLLRQAPTALFPENGLIFGTKSALLGGVANLVLAGGKSWLAQV